MKFRVFSKPFLVLLIESEDETWVIGNKHNMTVSRFGTCFLLV